MTNKWGNNGNTERLFSWAPKSLQIVTAAVKLKRHLLLGRKVKLLSHVRLLVSQWTVACQTPLSMGFSRQ